MTKRGRPPCQIINGERKPVTGRYKKLQTLYENGLLMSSDFYSEVVNYIKLVLGRYLRTAGGFDEDNVADCYLLILEKVSRNYDPIKGSLGTFIFTCIRNYTTKVKYKLDTRGETLPLDTDIESTYDDYGYSEKVCDYFHAHKRNIKKIESNYIDIDVAKKIVSWDKQLGDILF